MSSTIFSAGTVVTSDWLNEVNQSIYGEAAGPLTLDLIDTTSATKNAGRIGYNASLSYPLNTVGYAIKQLEAGGGGGGGSGQNVYINPKDSPYNAVGDGVADDTAEIQAAINAATLEKAYVIIPPGTFNVGRLYVNNGVRGILGAGGTLKLLPVINAGLTLESQSGEGIVNDLVIQNLNIDANSNVPTTVCIWGINVYNVRILDNNIYNVIRGYGILLRNYIGATTGGGNRVQRNRVFADARNTSGALQNVDGIFVDCVQEIDTTGYPSPSVAPPATHLWRTTWTTAVPSTYNSGNIITDNRVYGGYYGFGLQGLADSVVANNSTQANQRGFSLQDTAIRNTITGNYIFECYSAGIHLAFGSNNNLISNNHIYTTVGGGEALLQAYIGCYSNVFKGNRVHCSSGNSQHAIYIAVESSNCEVSENTITGSYQNAYIAIASAWNASTTNTYSYGRNSAGTNTEWMAHAALDGTVIKGNTIKRVSSTIPGILLDQVVTYSATTYTNPSGSISTWNAAYTDSYSAQITNTIIEDNKIMGTNAANTMLMYEGTSGHNSGTILRNNYFQIASSGAPYLVSTLATYFVFPRGRAHFEITENNQNYDKNTFDITLPAGTPSVAVGEWFVQQAGTQATSFLNGVNGQEIIVKMNSTSSIVHSGSGTADTINLNGGRTIFSGEASANTLIYFQRRGGVWWETYRTDLRKNSPVIVTQSSTSCASGGAFTKVEFTNVVTNVNSEWASNTFTCKVAGSYQINCSLGISGLGNFYDIDEQTRVDIYIGGVRKYAGVTQLTEDNAISNNRQTSISITVDLAQSETVEFYIFHNGDASVSLNNSAIACWATIAKVA